jgi:hypothetical protein
MRIWPGGKALLIGICMMAGSRAWSQSINFEQEAPARFDVAFTYNPVVANVTTGNEFGMQGGSVQVQTKLWRRVCAVADVAGFHTSNVNGSRTGLDLITATFGPRYVWSPSHRRLVLSGQALVGEAHGLNSIFPSSTGTNSTGNSVAFEVGGAINFLLTQHFSVRALDADWLRTQLPNATTNVQNNLRLGVGMVYRIR